MRLFRVLLSESADDLGTSLDKLNQAIQNIKQGKVELNQSTKGQLETLIADVDPYLTEVLGKLSIGFKDSTLVKQAFSMLSNLAIMTAKMPIGHLEKLLVDAKNDLVPESKLSPKVKKELDEELGNILKKYDKLKKGESDSEDSEESEETDDLKGAEGTEEEPKSPPKPAPSLGDLFGNLKKSLSKTKGKEDDGDELEQAINTLKKSEGKYSQLAAAKKIAALTEPDEKPQEKKPLEQPKKSKPEAPMPKKPTPQKPKVKLTQPPKAQVEPTPRSPHQYSPGAKNVAIVRKTGDTALARVRILNQDRKAVYKYFTIDSKSLSKVTGTPDLDEENIWDYLWKQYQTNKDQLKQHLTDVDGAFGRYEKLTGRDAPAQDLTDYVKRYTGETHKDMLINAFRRNESPNKADLLPVISKMSNDQVARLLEFYPLKKTGKFSDHAKKLLKTLRRRFSPLEESRLALALNVLLEAPIRQDTTLSKYLTAALRYDALVKAILSDPARFSQAMQRMGVNTEDLPQTQKATQKAAPKEEPPDILPVPDDDDDFATNLDDSQISQALPAKMEPTKRAEAIPVGFPDEEDPDKPAPEAPGMLRNLKKYVIYNPEAQTQPKFQDARILDALGHEYLGGILSRLAQKENNSELLSHLTKLKVVVERGNANDIRREWVNTPEDVKTWLRRKFPEALKSSQPYQKSETTKPGLLKRLDTWAQKPGVIEPTLRRFGSWAKSKLGFGESYARIIQSDLIVEEARLKANDLAYAALNIYVEQCNKLGRQSLTQMYDAKQQELFDKVVSEAIRASQHYNALLKAYGIHLEMSSKVEKPLLESLTKLVCQTASPLTEDGLKLLTANPQLVAEDYHKTYIGIKENTGKYIPLSNII